MNITRDHRAGTSDGSELLVIGTRRAAFDGPVLIMHKWALVKDHRDAVFSHSPLLSSPPTGSTARIASGSSNRIFESMRSEVFI